ncbi:MAG TPA: N-acetylmuramoyl-L-alanine amidase, partial [Allosphingosinicella sp.]
MAWLAAILLAIFGALGSGGHRSGSVTIPIDPPRADERGQLPTVTRARGENPPLVVIDPGHGGRDPGAASPFGERREKDITLALARAIRDDLAG